MRRVGGLLQLGHVHAQLGRCVCHLPSSRSRGTWPSPGQGAGNSRLLARGRRAFSGQTVPVTTVCRVSRFEIRGEEHAAKADAALRTWKLEVMDTVPGFIGVSRRLCKESWHFEIEVRFDCSEALESWMVSDKFQMETLPRLAEYLTKNSPGGVRGVQRGTFAFEDL
ncbi:unnamed protein product [Polarella glacialis]|uniref:ABM domain-containing protein n=1 Tax=Polarella glacialis TaxID=89957 RepID=A0A813H946_POLGL|nr:unnamed protein product [Polarella glacialis]